MLELGDEKMSKSLGNVVTLRNVLDTWGRETLLLYHMSGHWRKPVDFTDESLESVRTQLAGFRRRWRCRCGRRPTGSSSRRRSRTTSTRRRCSRSSTCGLRAGRGTSSRGGSTSSGSQTEFEVPAEIESAARRREAARAAKDWEAADAARAEIEAAGWAVTDHPGGTAVWLRP